VQLLTEQVALVVGGDGLELFAGTGPIGAGVVGVGIVGVGIIADGIICELPFVVGAIADGIICELPFTVVFPVAFAVLLLAFVAQIPALRIKLMSHMLQNVSLTHETHPAPHGTQTEIFK